jgi:hypothetical protein
VRFSCKPFQDPADFSEPIGDFRHEVSLPRLLFLLAHRAERQKSSESTTSPCRSGNGSASSDSPGANCWAALAIQRCH